MIDKWKELQVNDLPPDILTGDYEFEFDNSASTDPVAIWKGSDMSIGKMLDRFMEGRITYRYRKPEQTTIEKTKILMSELKKMGVTAQEVIDHLTPEPTEPLIVKSGETWVAHWEGVDYLWMKPEGQEVVEFQIGYSGRDSFSYWKSFTGPNPDIVELTDEIAVLRPMVRDAAEIVMLVYSKGEDYQVTMNLTDGEDLALTAGCLLATAKELKQV